MIRSNKKKTTLADEVFKKKKAMEQQQNKEKKKMLIAYISVGTLALLVIVAGIFNVSGESKTESVGFETPEITDRDKYNSKIEALEAKEKRISNTSLIDIFSQKKQDTSTGRSQEEENLMKNLEALEERSKKQAQPVRTSRIPKKEVYSENKSQNKNDNALTYAQRLKLEKEARYGTKATSTTLREQKVETRVAVFRDQFLMPGQLAELVLTKSFTYQGKTYKKGTPVYGYINISKTRVLFDIQNIAHQPLNIEVRDIRDGLIGMYSSRAGELWKKYETEAINNTTDEVAAEIARDGILATSIDAISKFFQKKKINKNEKIMLLNDQELIVNILDKK